MISDLQKTFKTLTKSLEILYVINNLKPAARIIIDENDKENVANFLKNNKLDFSISNFKIKKEVSDDKAYSDKGFRIPADSKEKGQFFIYVSKGKDKAELAEKLENENKHRELGILLGYPECCSEFFEKNFPAESKKQNEYVLPALKSSAGFRFPFYNNILARYFDISLLSHFPCSFSCEESIAIAKKHLAIIKKYFKELADLFEKTLKCAAIYTENSGVFLLKTEKIKGNIIEYSSVLPTIKNSINDMLKENNRIEIVKNNHLKIGDNELKGEEIGVMVFG